MTPVSNSARPAFSFPVRVYYEDTDQAGVVYYAGYLRFLERGRTEWLRALGVEQFRLAQDTGIAFAVRSMNIEYLRPARLDDLVAVVTEVESIGRAQVAFAQRIERDGEVLVEASVRVACLDLRRMKPAALPDEIRARMEMTTIPPSPAPGAGVTSHLPRLAGEEGRGSRQLPRASAGGPAEEP